MAPARPEDRAPECIAFGAALRLLRLKSGKKQQEVAAAAKITKAMLSAYETGASYPSLPTLLPLLQALGTDFRDLQSALDTLAGGQGGEIASVGGSASSSAEAALKGLTLAERQREIGRAVLAIASAFQTEAD